MIKMSDKDYFASEGISNSDFRLLKESALHLENKEYFRLESKALSIGSLTHAMVLEPETVQNNYAIEDFEGHDLNKNSKAYKEAKAKFIEESEGKEIVSSADFEKVTAMARNVKAIAGGLLRNGHAEVAFFGEMDNLKTKCKADFYRPDDGIVIDLKTTASIKDFRNSMVNYGYITQASWYIDVINSTGAKASRFVFILVETQKPYMVSVVEMGQITIQEGRSLYGEYLREWKDYKENGIVSVVKTIEAPDWWLDYRGAK